MKKRILGLLCTVCLACTLLPGTALAAGLDTFTYSNHYQNEFQDVARTDWFYSNVVSAFELGLMKGTSGNWFNTTGVVTLAETVTLAARLHSIYCTGTETFVQTGDTWYQVYVDYARANGILSRDYEAYNQPATRAQCVEILANALPASALASKNTVEDGAIPDVPAGAGYASAAYLFYRAGILTGSNSLGTFAPQTSISRVEIAAVVSRMADPALRKSFQLTNGSAIFKELAAKDVFFSFASGAGGWSTELEVAADGTFQGSFHDSDMGSSGPGYPYGTVYLSEFYGSFGSPKKISAYEYSVQLTSLQTVTKPGTTKILDGVKYIYSTPYGMENGKEFRIYCPGIKTSSLPASYIDWVRMPMAWSQDEIPAALPFYGLYNTADEAGFFS
jgi:hypothetical protein